MNIKLRNPFSNALFEAEIAKESLFFFADDKKKRSAILTIGPNSKPKAWIGDFSLGIKLIRGREVSYV